MVPSVRRACRALPSIELLETRRLLSTYYVSTAGSDSAVGGAAAPWRTIQHAADLAVAGDTVIVEPGRYAGFNISNSGAPGQPITFHAQSGVVINRPVNFGGGIFGINASDKDYIVIDGFAIRPQDPEVAWKDGIRIGGTPGEWVVGAVIQNNTVQMRVVDQSPNVDQLGIFTSWTDGLLVQNNDVSGGWDSGIYVSNSAMNYKVLNNTVHDVGGNGIHNNGDAGQGGTGINTNAVIAGNVIHHVGFGIGGQAISCDGLQNSLIENNLIYDAFSKGISLYVTDAADGSKNNVIAGNTVLVNATGYVPLRMTGDSTGNVIFDNIFQAPTPSGAWVDAEGGSLGDGTAIDYNVTTGVTLIDGDKAGADWQNMYGFGTHTTVSRDPAQLFFDPAATVYHLSATSPAIDAGVASFAGHSAPGTDLDGNPRGSGGGYDAGAYELQYLDSTSPALKTGFPAAGATGVPSDTAIRLVFNKATHASTLSFELRDGNNNLVPVTAQYDDAARAVTLTPLQPLDSSTTYTATLIGVEDLTGNGMTEPVAWSFTTAPPDLTPPTVTLLSPADGSVSDPAGATRVTVTFSESIQPSTLSLLLKDASGNVIPSTVSYDDTLYTATLVPLQALTYDAPYTVTVAGAADLAGNVMTAPVTHGFRTAPLGTGPFTLWPSDAAPGVADDPDLRSSEVGVKFYSDVAGIITGMRFYKGRLNTGVHIGHLWSSTGQVLASVTFTDESEEGWQEATFSTAVPITANTMYVISYWAPDGGYSDDIGAFTTEGADSGPLHAPMSDAAEGGNGVYAYGPSPLFPTEGFFDSNYWVEPILAISPVVVGRYLFYNNSSFDGNDPAGSAASDNAAIATNKLALFPGHTATFGNYTSYSNGINGLIIDVSSLASDTLSTNDFSFLVGNSTNLSAWTAAPAPTSITVFRGKGVNGSDRIEIIWPDGAISDKWLQVTVQATTNTGLLTPDVFYFGNAVAETGNDPTNAVVNSADDLGARNNKTGLGTADVTNPYDFNRDGRVNTADELIARNNHSGLSPLKLIATPPSQETATIAALPQPAPMVTTAVPTTAVNALSPVIFAAQPAMTYALALPAPASIGRTSPVSGVPQSPPAGMKPSPATTTSSRPARRASVVPSVALDQPGRVRRPTTKPIHRSPGLGNRIGSTPIPIPAILTFVSDDPDTAMANRRRWLQDGRLGDRRS